MNDQAFGFGDPLAIELRVWPIAWVMVDVVMTLSSCAPLLRDSEPVAGG